MKNLNEAIRELQKTGEYEYTEVSKEESKKLARQLAQAAWTADIENGIENTEYGIARDAFGRYSAYVEVTY